jgi:ribosomal protein L34E
MSRFVTPTAPSKEARTVERGAGGARQLSCVQTRIKRDDTQEIG